MTIAIVISLLFASFCIYMSVKTAKRNKELRKQLEEKTKSPTTITVDLNPRKRSSTSKKTTGAHGNPMEFANRKVRSDILESPDLSQIESGSFLYGSKVVITGLFDAFPDRNELAAYLKSLGADIQTSISSKTNYVIVGRDPGPSKMAKIDEINATAIPVKKIIKLTEQMLIDRLGVESCNPANKLEREFSCKNIEIPEIEQKDIDEFEAAIRDYKPEVAFFNDVSFAKKKIVLTGVFEHDLSLKLKKYDAILEPDLSEETEIVICGDSPNRRLLKQISDLISSGRLLEVMDETQCLDCFVNLELKDAGIRRTSSWSLNRIPRILINEQIRAHRIEKDDVDESISIYQNIIDMNYYLPFPFERLAINYRKRKEYEKENDILNDWYDNAIKNTDTKSIEKISVRKDFLSKRLI